MQILISLLLFAAGFGLTGMFASVLVGGGRVVIADHPSVLIFELFLSIILAFTGFAYAIIKVVKLLRRQPNEFPVEKER